MARYLVTGGAGFIGTNLTKQLLADGHEVVVFDNYSAGKFKNRIQKGAHYIKGDIRKLNQLRRAVKGMDGIFHVAAVPRVPYSIEHPLETNENNITGTLNVLVAARDAKVKRVVFSSSGSVYGNNEVGKRLVETMPPSPLTPYALHKLAGEAYCRMFAEFYGLETVSLRYFNVYGPFVDPNGAYALVIGKFMRQLSQGEPMTICGDGEYYRDYTHVSDVVAANILAMTSPNVGKGEVLNVGFGQAYSVNQLAKMIGGPTTPVPARSGDPRFNEADSSLAEKLIGWKPKIPLSEGIKTMKAEWKII